MEPSAIAIDSEKNIYIADPLNHRIQKFNAEGRYLTKITFEDQSETFAFTINDLEIDDKDNVYILSGRGQKILKYNSRGKLIRSIKLQDYMMPERLGLDAVGNIYVFGTVLVDVPGRGKEYRENCLRKFDKKGTLVKEWNNASIPFIDHEGAVYLRQESSWKKYDKIGKFVSDVKCETEKQKVYFENACHFPPYFIDERGFLYYFASDPKTHKLTALFRFNKKGKSKKYSISTIKIWPAPHTENMVKFDKNGNLYGYGYDDTKKEYRIINVKLK